MNRQYIFLIAKGCTNFFQRDQPCPHMGIFKIESSVLAFYCLRVNVCDCGRVVQNGVLTIASIVKDSRYARG